MSEQNLNLLRQKISDFETSLNEIVSLHKAISQDKGLLQIEQQLVEINKAITNLQNIQTPVPDELRELKNKITNELLVKTEADKLFNSFIQLVNSISLNYTTVLSSSINSKFSRLDPAETLKLVISVINSVSNDKMKLSKAFIKTAQKYRISATAVRNKCSKQIALDLKSFKQLLINNPQALIEHLIRTFPEQESLILKEKHN